MNTTYSGYRINRPDTYTVIRGSSDDWSHLHTDSAQLEQLCRISLCAPDITVSPDRLIRALELLRNKLSVLLNYSQSLEDYLRGVAVSPLPGSASCSDIMLLSEAYLLKLLRAASLLKNFLTIARQARERSPARLSNDIASHYTAHIKHCLTPGKNDFCRLTELITAHNRG